MQACVLPFIVINSAHTNNADMHYILKYAFRHRYISNNSLVGRAFPECMDVCLLT